MRYLSCLAVASAFLLGAPAWADEHQPPPHLAKRCQENPEKCEEIKNKRKEFCATNPETCEKRREAREQRREWCKDNPEECQKRKEEMKAKREAHKEQCKANPEDCKRPWKKGPPPPEEAAE